MFGVNEINMPQGRGAITLKIGRIPWRPSFFFVPLVLYQCLIPGIFFKSANNTKKLLINQ